MEFIAPLFNHFLSLKRSLAMYFEIDCHCIICGGPFSYRDDGSWSSILLKPGSWGSGDLDSDRERRNGYDPKVLQEKNIKWLGHSRLLSGEARGEASR